MCQYSLFVPPNSIFIHIPTGASNTGRESTKPQGGDVAEIFLYARKKKLQLDYWSHFIMKRLNKSQRNGEIFDSKLVDIDHEVNKLSQIVISML